MNTDGRGATTRLDSSLESAGAEFLVLGLLLVEGISAWKAYANFPAYDIVAVAPEGHRSCRIQVKSRWATDYDGGFPIRNFECDFVVFVALNRGYRQRRKRTESDAGRQPPKVYVFPVEVVRAAQSPASTWGKVFLRNIPDCDGYVEKWELVRASLRVQSPAASPREKIASSAASGGGGRVKLHDEIARILRAAGGPVRAPQIAEAVNRIGNYRKRTNTPVSSRQIHARVSKKPELFRRTSEGIALR